MLPSPDLLTIKVDDTLLRALDSREWGRPMALGTVVQESVARKEMYALKEFMDAPESVYVRKWDLSLGSVVGWGLRALGILGGKVPTGKLIMMASLEECGRLFLERVGSGRGRVERLFSRTAFEEEFRDLCGEKGLSKGDFEVLLRFLERDKEVLVFDKATVKLRAAEEEKSITQEDATIAGLKTLIAGLETQTVLLAGRIETLGQQAKAAVEKKNRVSALAALRSKKLAESTLAKRHATLSQLEETFVKIEQAVDQVELVRIMEGSTRVLAGLNKQVGGVEKVDDVVDRLREQMLQVNEVGDVLAEQGRDGIDESEVDDELEAMERAEKEKQEAEERKVKEEQDRKEAEETKKKLAELEEVERQAAKDRAVKEKILKEQKQKDAQSESLEKDLQKSMDDLKRMNLEPAQEAT